MNYPETQIALIKLGLDLGFETTVNYKTFIDALVKSANSINDSTTKKSLRGVGEAQIKNWFSGSHRPNPVSFRMIVLGVYNKQKNTDGCHINNKKEIENRVREIQHLDLQAQIEPESNDSETTQILTIINNDFFKQIEQEAIEKDFKSTDFYLALKDSECQWYGITQNWDYLREIYQPIKESVVSSFNEYRQATISAFIIGHGGSGKSILLRRLAFDLRDEDFSVIWLNDQQAEGFINSGGVDKLRNQEKNYLVLIEDWYRIKRNTVPEIANSLINQLASLKNVRIVIGDRDKPDHKISEKIYISYEQTENYIEVIPSENKRVLSRVKEASPEWEEIINGFLEAKDKEINNMSLYQLLFCIGYDNGESKINYGDIIGRNRSIARSHLKRIEKQYPNVAKMLFYYACYYKNYKRHIPKELFFKLADLMEPNSPNTADKVLVSEAKNILFIYLNHGEFLKFNHDTLADELLANINSTDYQYDFAVRVKLVENYIKLGNPEYGVPLFEVLYKNEDSDSLKGAKLQIIQKAYDKGFRFNYLSSLFSGDLISKDKRSVWAEKIINDYINQQQKITTETVIASSLKNLDNQKLRQEKSAEILQQEKSWKLIPIIICTALNKAGPSIAKEKSSVILQQEKFWELPYSIISTALNKAEPSIAKEKSGEILQQEAFWELPFEIISTALNKAEASLAEEKSGEILQQEAFWKLPDSIINTALNKAEPSLAEEKSGEILQQEAFLELPKEIISTALSKAEASITKEKSGEILQQEAFWKLPHHIIITALNNAEPSMAEEMSGEILQHEEFWKFPSDFILTILKKADEDKAQKISLNFLKINDWNFINKHLLSTLLFKANDQELSLKVLSNIYKYEPSLIHNALHSFLDSSLPPEVHCCINRIIRDYSTDLKKHPHSRKYLLYINLMKLPFYKNDNWKASNYENIRNWKIRQKIIVTNTIMANRAYPNEIRAMCSDILESCEIEITKRVFVPFKKPNYGNHVMLSLGHPDLREEALKAATKLSQMNLDKLPDFMNDTFLAIVEKGEYPEW